MSETIRLSEDVKVDKQALAKFLTVQYDYDKIIDYLKLKLPLPIEGRDVEADKDRALRFNKYVEEYGLTWLTYLDEHGNFLTEKVGQPAIAYTGDLGHYVEKRGQSLIEADTNVAAYLGHYEYIKLDSSVHSPWWWEVKKLDDDFAIAYLFEGTTCRFKMVGRINTILFDLSNIASSAVATHGEEWFATEMAKQWERRLSSPDSSLLILYAVPGPSGCNCNRLLKNQGHGVWRLTDCVEDFIVNWRD